MKDIDLKNGKLSISDKNSSISVLLDKQELRKLRSEIDSYFYYEGEYGDIRFNYIVIDYVPFGEERKNIIFKTILTEQEFYMYMNSVKISLKLGYARHSEINTEKVRVTCDMTYFENNENFIISFIQYKNITTKNLERLKAYYELSEEVIIHDTILDMVKEKYDITIDPKKLEMYNRYDTYIYMNFVDFNGNDNIKIYRADFLGLEFYDIIMNSVSGDKFKKISKNTSIKIDDISIQFRTCFETSEKSVIIGHIKHDKDFIDNIKNINQKYFMKEILSVDKLNKILKDRFTEIENVETSIFIYKRYDRFDTPKVLEINIHSGLSFKFRDILYSMNCNLKANSHTPITGNIKKAIRIISGEYEIESYKNNLNVVTEIPGNYDHLYAEEDILEAISIFMKDN